MSIVQDLRSCKFSKYEVSPSVTKCENCPESHRSHSLHISCSLCFILCFIATASHKMHEIFCLQSSPGGTVSSCIKLQADSSHSEKKTRFSCFKAYKQHTKQTYHNTSLLNARINTTARALLEKIDSHTLLPESRYFDLTILDCNVTSILNTLWLNACCQF